MRHKSCTCPGNESIMLKIYLHCQCFPLSGNEALRSRLKKSCSFAIPALNLGKFPFHTRYGKEVLINLYK